MPTTFSAPTSCEDGQWEQDLDDELHKGLELLLGTATGAAHRELAGFSAQDGGLAFASLTRCSVPAFLGSWALNFE